MEKELEERCMWQGKRRNREREIEPFIQLACAIFLSACHDVISETKAGVGIDLRHS